VSLGKRVALVLIGILLVSTIGAANATLTMDRTVMNPDFVSNTAEEEGVYADLADNVTRQIGDDLEGVDPAQSGQLPPQVDVNGVNTGEIADEAVTEEYVASQGQQAIRALYAYMEGERDRLDLVIDTEPVKESAQAAIAEEATAVDVAPLVGLGAENVNSRVPISADGAERLLDGPESYRAEQERFREDIRQQVRSETGASGEELDRQVDSTLQDLNDRTKTQVRDGTSQATQEYSENVTSAVTNLQYAMVDAYTTDQSYQSFAATVDSEQQSLGEEAARIASQEIDAQIDDQYRLSELLGEGGQQNLRSGADRGAGVFGTLSTMSLVWPLVSLVLIGIAYVVTRSLHATGRVTAGAMISAAVAGFLVATVLQGTVVDILRGEIGSADGPVSAGDFAVGLVEGFLGTLAAQSLVIGVFGVLLFALVYADRNGYLDGLKTKAGVGTASGAGGGQSRGGQQQYQQTRNTQGGQPGQQGGGQPNHQQGGQPQSGQPNRQRGGQPQGGRPQGGQPTDDSGGQDRSGSGSGQPNDR
jgi:hypothetical protein